MFSSVFLSAHPEKTQELLKYMHIVRMAAARFGGRGWLEYDRQFRMRQQSHPSRSWSVIDGELWAMFVAAPGSPYYAGSGGQGAGGPYTYAGKQRFSNLSRGNFKQPFRSFGYCFAFNRSGCPKPQCKYTHKCSTCQATGHGAASCKAGPDKLSSGQKA